MKPPIQTYLTELESAAIAANQAEDELQKRMAQEMKRLERERAFAWRRLNLMRSVASAIAEAEDEENAIACGKAALVTELGWAMESETRTETLNRFAAVAGAAYRGLCPPEGDEAAPDVAGELAQFESWYETTFGQPFWTLFDRHIPEELPLVER